MIDFINEHRAIHGVKPICRVLLIAPSTYNAYAALATFRACAINASFEV